MLVAIVLMFVCGLVLCFCFLAYLIHGIPASCKSDSRLDGKVALITGGTSGIGRAVAVDLARRGAKIYVTGRNDAKGREAVSYIQSESQNPDVYFSYLDLTDFDSIKCLANHISSIETSLNILINNAGIGATYEETTPSGGDTIFTTNYLGHFLLTLLLLDLLKSAPGQSRIVNTAAMSHQFVRSLDLCVRSEQHGDCLYPQLRGYDVSKLAMVLHVKELTRRLAGSSVTANAAVPSLSLTNFWHTTGTWWPGPVAMVVRWILSPVARPPAQAAQTLVHCAVAADLCTVSGRYYERCVRRPESALARDSELSARLWDVSLLLAGCHGDGAPVRIHPAYCRLDEDEMWRRKMARLRALESGREAPPLAPEVTVTITRS